MNRPTDPIFATRPTVSIEFPLGKKIRILHPEQVMLIIDAHTFDFGSFCYAIRSSKRRKPGQQREVVLGSFLKQRPKQILQIIKVLSRLVSDGGKKNETVKTYIRTSLKPFLDWADTCGRSDCLSGGDATRNAIQGWVNECQERYRRQEFGERNYNDRICYIGGILEAATGLNDLIRGYDLIKISKKLDGTEPFPLHDFATSISLSQALFDGLCDLILEKKQFPYKLVLPKTLGWADNHLWLFPTNKWCLPPHQWDAEREKLNFTCWGYNYKSGRLARPNEISHYYKGKFPSVRMMAAKIAIRNAKAQIEAANANERNKYRILLGMIAHNAFLFLFFCSTGANYAVVREIETNGVIDTDAVNQRFRSIKLRAGGKPIVLTVPTTFMPSLRRFIALRKYLLDTKTYPYLFFTLGKTNVKTPRQIGLSTLTSLVQKLRNIDPQLPIIGSQKLRSSVADWYQRHYDASITAKVLQNSEQTALMHYNAGSATDHRLELTLFLNSVSESAKRQRVVLNAPKGARPLDEGGCCDNYGNPDDLVNNPPVKPNCKTGQGCMFCFHRILTPREEDVRKVASAAFVMEQVILGPMHEKSLRPLISKCDKDIEKIATFGSCQEMVEQVRRDVFQNGNLTPFFADKFQLFLELGLIT